MLQSFLTYINVHQIITPTDRILLAVSGGVDSVVLADLFFKANYSFAIAHCNFQLRGIDSENDEEFAKNVAQSYGVPFYSKKFDVENHCLQHGVSTQMAARTLRYAWFDEIKKARQFDYLATAHHQNDSIETVLLNLVRGTGIAGLHGILPKQQFVIRPLLFATKTQIIDFAQTQNLTWREDTSNQTTKYKRNLIRHQVVPLLKTINPQFESKMAETTEQLSAVEKVFAQKADEIKASAVQHIDDYIQINCQVLRVQIEPVIVLYYFLKLYGFDYQQTKQIWASVDGQSGKRFFSEKFILHKDRNSFIIKKSDIFTDSIEADSQLIWPDSGLENIGLTFLDTTQLTSDQLKFGSVNEIFVDLDTLTFPLTLRKWQAGDWFCPFGMNGRRKKVSDFLIDKKYPLALKGSVLVLSSADNIVWLVGHRTDERFKITQATKNICKISII